LNLSAPDNYAMRAGEVHVWKVSLLSRKITPDLPT
jgi:hypothetical protein